MIETAMLVALGFLAATLLALLAVPFVSRRAARLALLRLHDSMPVSSEEIAAERDGIRAVSAVEQRRLEQKVERAMAAAASLEADLGRRKVELKALNEAREADRLKKSVLMQNGDRLRSALSDLTAELDESRRMTGEVEGRLRKEQEEHEAVRLKRDNLDELAEERRGLIASLETRSAGLEARLVDRTQELERERGETAQLRTRLGELSRERDLGRRELLRANTQRAMLQDEAKHLTARADTYRDRLLAGNEALARTERSLTERTAEHKATAAALADLRRRFELLEARLIGIGGVAAQTLVDTEMDAMREAVAATADEALRVLDPAGVPDDD